MNVLVSDIKNINIDNYKVFDYDDINYCKGCFSCWINTPTKCIYKDKCYNTSKYFVNTENIVIISKNVYGSYSSIVKRILERNISLVYPYFVIRDNEIHHKMRKDDKTNLIVIFYGDISGNDKKISKKLIERNKINFNYDKTKIYYLKDENEVRSKLNDIVFKCKSKIKK